MVHISRVYTRFGDAGATMLADGSTATKDDPRVEAVGAVDELNAVLGLLRVEVADRAGVGMELDSELHRIQNELFNLGAELATPPGGDTPAQFLLAARHVERLEQELDHHNAALEPLRSFVLPGGAPAAAAAHLARTVCRRAERRVVALARASAVRPELLRYVNRLGDYLFVVARAANHGAGVPEILWRPEEI